MAQQLLHSFYRIDSESLGQSGLGSVFRRDVKFLHTRAGGGHGHGENAGDRAQGPGQGQLPQESGLRSRRVYISLGGQNTQENGKVVDGAFLSQSGGGQIDGNSGDGEFGPTAFDSGADSFSGFLDGGVGKTHHVEGGEAP